MLAVSVLTGGTTVLLGLRGLLDWDTGFVTIALVSSALATVVNAWDSHFDHRALWVQRSIVLQQLQELNRDVERYDASLDESLPTQRMTQVFAERLNGIFRYDIASWAAMRGSELPGTENS